MSQLTTLPPRHQIKPYPYYIMRKLGVQGGMSEVYLAEMSAKEAEPSGANPLQKKSGLKSPVKRVILKIARIHDDPDFNQSALRKEESKLVRLNELNHPAIVKILPIRPKVYLARADSLGQPWFMVLEYLEGGTLRDLLVNTKKTQKDEFAGVDLEMALQIVYTLAGALVAIHAPHETEYGHDPGIAHLDIKPGNILFRTKPVQGEEVEPVLVDFGIAGDIGHGDLEAGTLQYMSRERIRYVKEWEKPDGGMDVFALGVVLYEMLAGRHPFLWRLEAQTKRELTDEEIIDAICNVTPAPVSEFASSIPKSVRPRLNALVSNMLSDDPTMRPAADFLQTETQEILSLTQRARGRKHLAKRLAWVGLLFLATVLVYFSWPLIRQSASTIANSFRTSAPAMVVPPTEIPTATVSPTFTSTKTAVPSSSIAISTAISVTPTIVISPVLTPTVTAQPAATPTRIVLPNREQVPTRPPGFDADTVRTGTVTNQRSEIYHLEPVESDARVIVKIEDGITDQNLRNQGWGVIAQVFNTSDGAKKGDATPGNDLDVKTSGLQKLYIEISTRADSQGYTVTLVNARFINAP